MCRTQVLGRAVDVVELTLCVKFAGDPDELSRTLSQFRGQPRYNSVRKFETEICDGNGSHSTRLCDIAGAASFLAAGLLRQPQLVKSEDPRIDARHVQGNPIPADYGLLDLRRIYQPTGTLDGNGVKIIRR